MGMYTEFHFNSRLKSDVPQSVINILNYMLTGDSDTAIPPLPQHALFATYRWNFMLCSNSCYFDADTHSTLRKDELFNEYHLCIRCNLKNYEGEIGKFVNWITPYLDKQEGDFLGFSRYEETEEPTLIYMGKS